MVTRIGTGRRKTRYKFKQHYRERGKIPLRRFFQNLAIGDKVNLKVCPQVQKGQFFRRFHGTNGTITGKRGSCYEVTIYDGGKQKVMYVHPVHLTK